MGLGKLIYDSAVGKRIPTEYANQDEREDAIRQKLFETLGVSVYEKNSFRKAMRKHKGEVYEIQEEIIDQVLVNGDYAKDSFFTQFVDLKNKQLGDENTFYIEGDNELTVAEFSGSHFNLKRRRVDVGESFGVEMKDFGLAVYEYVDRIASGRADYAKIVAMIAVAVNKHLTQLAQTTFASALANLPAEFKGAGTYNEEQIMEVASHVQASTGIKPYFLGTSVAIRKLQGIKDVASLSNGMLDEKNQKGFLAVWNGYACVELAQGHKANSFTFTMDNNVVYVFSGGEKPVKMYIEGESEVREVGDTWNGAMNADKSVEQQLTYKAGATVAYNKLLGTIIFA